MERIAFIVVAAMLGLFAWDTFENDGAWRREVGQAVKQSVDETLSNIGFPAP